MSDAPLASVELRVLNSDRWGRVFLPVDVLPGINLREVAAAFNRTFSEPDDMERLSLLERALARSVVTVETYPGETPPQELHVYLRVAEVSDDPIFACVLAPPPVVRELASQSPHLVMETGSFQAMSGEVTNASITSGVEAWIRRMWPTIRVPTLLLSPWPGPIETKEGALEFLRLFPSAAESPGDLTSAPAAFSPPADLVAQEFLPREQAAHESELQRSLRKNRLSSRARGVLQYIVSAEHERMRKHPILAISLTDTELLRRAAKVEPPLSFHVLRTRYRNCGVVTAREICVAMGLPSELQKVAQRVQCPRCGHAFGGQR